MVVVPRRFSRLGWGFPASYPASEKIIVSGKPMKYHIATVPKKIELGDNGTYCDWETGVGVAVY